MRAAWFEQHGPARQVLQTGELATPAPAQGEVLVRIHCSGINPSDVKRRAGSRDSAMEFSLVVPHSDGAGVIEAVGDGVSRDRVGERVWLTNAQRGRAYGTAAEFCALPADQAIPLPASVSFAEGACLGIPALTAHRCLHAPGPVQGKTVLITGGAGAVGNAAIQLAKWAGATVIGTVSGAEKAGHAFRAGADHVINYRTENVVARVQELTDGTGADRVVDVAFGANLPMTAAAVCTNGSIATYGSDAEPEPRLPVYLLMGKSITVYFVLVYLLPREIRQLGIADVTAALAAGALQPAVAARFPLAEIAAAHEAVESGALVGNAVVDLL